MLPLIPRSLLRAIAKPSTPVDQFAALQAGAALAATSQHNNLPHPTEAQAKAGNYTLGRATVAGFDIRIENPLGSVRRGVGEDGQPWENRMAAHYGYIAGTKGADGDGIDVFVGPWPEGPHAWVLNQTDAAGNFDEHKVLLGFSDEASAVNAYRNSYDKGWNRYSRPIKLTAGQLRWWLRLGDTCAPFSIDKVPASAGSEIDHMNQMQMKPLAPIYWGADAAPPAGATHASILLDLHRHDGVDRLLLDAVTMADVKEAMVGDGMLLDAVVVEVGSLKPKMDAMQRMLDAAGGEIKTVGYQISDPMRRGGVVQIAVVFELSDGQTVTVWLHNPDTTPAKLTPADELVSWKWQLNKKDITIVVAPESGKELDVRQVARRVMALAIKNSPAFAKANAGRAERMQRIQGLRDELAQGQARLTELNGQIEVAKEAKKQREEQAAAASKNQFANIPKQVEMQVTTALAMLNEVSSAVANGRALDQKFGGGGRYESETFSNRAKDIASAKSKLEKFKSFAPGNGVDAGAFIESLGGEPDLTPSDAAKSWMREESPATQPAGGDMFGAPPAAPMGFSDFLKAGRLSEAVEMLSALPFQQAHEMFMRAGFSMGSLKKKTTAELIAFAQPQLVKAAQARTDGWGLRKDEPPVFGEQAPEPAAGNPELAPEGRESIVKTAKGNKVSTGFAVVEAASLIVSHDADGNANPDYPMELQPRDRARATSQAWVKKTAQQLDPESLGRTTRADTGAPIVGKDRVVESGNGRTMAIIEAYRIGKADEYRAWLESEAEYFGINPSKVRAMKRPVLVRVRTSEVDRRAFAVEANQDDKLGMTATEKARADAKRLDTALLSYLPEDGDLGATSAREFLSGFLKSLGDAEAAQYITSDGKPTASLIARVQAAIFAKAYADDRLLELTADSAKPEIANIVSALNAAAPDFVRAMDANQRATEDAAQSLTDGIELSLNQQAVAAIIGATNLVKQARDSGMQVDEFVKQQGLFGDTDPAIAAVAVFIAKNNRSAKRLGSAFKAMAQFIGAELQRRQNVDMFGDIGATVSMADVVSAANRQLEQEYGEGVFAIEQFGLFGAKAPVEGEAGTISAAPADPKRAETIATLEQIAAGTHPDIMSPGIFDVIGAALDAYPGDAEIEEAATRAVVKVEAGNLAATANLK